MAKKKRSNVGCLIFLVFIIVLFIIGMVNMIKDEVKNSQENAYSDSMSVLEDPDSVAVSGDKIVAYVTDNIDSESTPMFSKYYVPEDYVTEKPEEVRYILYCTEDAEVIGTYSGGGGFAKKLWVEIEIYDRQTNQVIATERFEGGHPPYSVNSNSYTKVHYGTAPDIEAIHNWVLTSISAVN